MSVAVVDPDAVKSALKDTVAAEPPAERLPVWTDERKATVKALIEKYADVLMIDDYEIDLVFHDKPCEEDATTAADTCGNYPYRMSNTINFYPRWIESTDQERRAVHELLHIVNDRLFRLLWRVVVKEQFVTWRESREQGEALAEHLTAVVLALVRK